MQKLESVPSKSLGNRTLRWRRLGVSLRSCARAMSGTAAAPPRPAMKSRSGRRQVSLDDCVGAQVAFRREDNWRISFGEQVSRLAGLY